MYLGIINGWEEGLRRIEFCANHNYDSAEILAKAQDIRSYSEKYDVKVRILGPDQVIERYKALLQAGMN